VQEKDYNFPCYSLNGMRSKLDPELPLLGREHILADIDKAFLPNDLPETLTALEEGVGLKTYCLYGAGGIGKTEIASHYATSRKGHFDVIIWLNARSHHPIKIGYMKFAKHLGIVDDNDIKDETIVMNQVQSWFEKPLRNRSQVTGPFARWLIVMDEVDEPEKLPVHEWCWPTASSPGCILVTGRQPDIQSVYFGTTGAEVGLLAREDAALMLRRITNTTEEHNGLFHASAIVQEWGCLPLTIMCIASVMTREGYSLAECASIDVLKKREHLLSTWRFLGRSHNLAEAWALTNLSPEESTLLDMASLLEPNKIQECIFTEFPEKACFLAAYPGVGGAKLFTDTRTALLKRSLIRRNTEGRYPFISIHRSIHDLLYARLFQSERLGDTFRVAVRLVGSLWPSVVTKDTNHSNLETKERDECDATVSHVERLTEVYHDLDAQLQISCATSSWVRLLVEAAWYVLYFPHLMFSSDRAIGFVLNDRT
jgi:hypothetical protein